MLAANTNGATDSESPEIHQFAPTHIIIPESLARTVTELKFRFRSEKTRCHTIIIPERAARTVR